MVDVKVCIKALSVHLNAICLKGIRLVVFLEYLIRGVGHETVDLFRKNVKT